MDDLITQERRDRLVEMFAKTAEFLTNMEALTIVQILEDACHRASADLEESMLLELISRDDPTPGEEE